MKKLAISFFSIILTIVFISGCNNMSFKTPFIKSENLQKGANVYEPDFYYKPFIWVVITNPLNGESVLASAIIDTGSDNCYMSRKLADYLGLVNTTELPLKTYIGDNSTMDSNAVEAAYTLADEK